jgi:hypothetical protein
MVNDIMASFLEMFNDDTFEVQACMIAADMDFHGVILSNKKEDPRQFRRRSL